MVLSINWSMVQFHVLEDNSWRLTSDQSRCGVYIGHPLLGGKPKPSLLVPGTGRPEPAIALDILHAIAATVGNCDNSALSARGNIFQLTFTCAKNAPVRTHP